MSSSKKTSATASGGKAKPASTPPSKLAWLGTHVVTPIGVAVVIAWSVKGLEWKLPMRSPEAGWNYEHGDLDADKWLSVASAEACADLCYQRNECVAMSYVVSNRSCWLKHSVSTKVANPDVVSAVRFRLWPW